MDFYYSNAVNVFTDASNLPSTKSRKTNIICPAFVVTINGSVIEYGSKLIKNATASYGELYALAMGIQTMLKYSDTGLPLNIFSDSEISVHGCTKWLEKWYSNGKKTFYLTKNDNQLVANQEIILDIIRMVSQSKSKIHILNILGHTDNKDVASMDKFVYYFYRANHIKGRVPIENMQEMAYFNDMVDNISRDALKSIQDSNHPLVCNKKKFPGFYWYPKDEDIKTYLNLVNK